MAKKTATKIKTTVLKKYKGVKVGAVVPDFHLPSTSGEDFRLQEARGQKVVLYFYPKDSTPGCTIESNDFSKLLKKFEKKNTMVLGVSRDSLKSHEKFRSQQALKFDLLSDGDEKLCKIFDVIQEKNMYGKKVVGIERSTFLIDEKGVLEKEWRKVKVEGHADEVLQSL